MPPQPLVTVIISLYNYGRFVEECVRSVLAQSHSNLQLIVVDNGSTDEGATLVAAIEDPRIERLSFPVNQGIASALNLGYTHAKGEWVAFLPADDRMHPDFVSHMLAAGEREGCNLVGCWMRVVDATGEPDPQYAKIYEKANNHESFDVRDFRRFRWENLLAHNTFLWKRTLADQCMPMMEAVIPCDWGMFIRASRTRCCTTILHEKLLDYRVHGSNLGLRTPSEEYMIHFMYVHLAEYRQVAQELAENPSQEISLCHKEFFIYAISHVANPDLQAKLVLASELGANIADRWPDFKSFLCYAFEEDMSENVHFVSLRELFAKLEDDKRLCDKRLADAELISSQALQALQYKHEQVLQQRCAEEARVLGLLEDANSGLQNMNLELDEAHRLTERMQREQESAKQRGDRLREELDGTKAVVNRLRTKLAEHSLPDNPRLARTFAKLSRFFAELARKRK